MWSFVIAFIVLSRLIHVVACVSNSFFFIIEKYSMAWTYHILFIQSSVHGHLGHFHCLSNMNNAVLNIHVQCGGFFLHGYIFLFLLAICLQVELLVIW